VRLQLSQKGVYLIPQKAVQEIQDRYFVFTVGENNIARMKAFVPITRVGNFFIVREGFTKGERIVAEGIRSVKDGAKVEIKSVRKNTFIP
jgi:membrane fusion protein (multidrug efflux system)